MSVLRRGDKGPRVVELQRAITAATDIPLAPDGIFGEATEQAVIVYQFGKGLDRDGIAGPITLRALGLDAAPSSAPPTQPTGDPHAIPTPPAGWIVGVDISDAQGIVDAKALHRAGVSFAWIKVSDGRHDGQKHAARNAKRFVDEGIAIGFYGVLEPYGEASVEEQVANFCRRSRETGIDPTLPDWCDFELARGLSGASALASAASWCELVQDVNGRRPMIYTGPAFISTLAKIAGGGARAILDRIEPFPLAVAHYGPTIERGPMVPGPWLDWTVWQYSGDPPIAGQKARPWSYMPGTKQPIDVDYFRGTIEDLIALGALA